MLNEMIEIAKGAGQVLMNIHGKKINYKQKNGVKGNLVSKADLASDNYIIKKASELLPEVKLLTEEMKGTLTDMSGKILIGDPLDGTSGFFFGPTGRYDGFCVILGLCENGVPVIGVVYDPLNKKLYYAEKSKGAFLEYKGIKTKLQVSKQKHLNDSILLLRDLKNVGEKNNLDFSLDKLPVKEKHEGVGCGIKTMGIASGKADVYIHTTHGWMIRKWDVCGVEAIIREAGGNIYNYNGTKLNYLQEEASFAKEAVIITNSHIDKELLNAL